MEVTQKDFRQIGTALLDALKPIAEETAQREAQMTVGRILRMDDDDLRNRLETALRKMVEDVAKEHLDVSVRWK